MNEKSVIKEFIEKVDKLEARYAKDKYATTFPMPREMMIALRDELKERVRIDDEYAAYEEGLRKVAAAIGKRGHW